MQAALIGSLISAMATVIGALPILFIKRLSEQWKDTLIAFTAGIMVSAATSSLIPQAIEESNPYLLTLGLLMGVVVLDLIEKSTPHLHVENLGFESMSNQTLLVIIALSLHNIPEGLSTGFSYASANESLGFIVALAIGVQNMPEGLILAVFLVHSHVSRLKSLLLVTLTGLMELLSAFVGYFAAGSISSIIGLGLAFAAGAMLFIVYKELIPESHGHGYERQSTYSFIAGLLVMIYITHFFG